ncbi:hypothetical protein HT102_12665 [Hoyosella sp. G463]|uniref:Uncharacterized protein n=1 Tax=Lolliginicoccus lacisalsi TaxID=2742202 RepID=A0A927PMZ6_9ACTN|nr:hypothetical protein [Lolliginicoccus lacisalsi]MBD8507337.1 hypothetical protein [Lolliginicoccus lacisalsi]
MDESVAAAISALDADDPAIAADAESAWHELVALSPPGGPIQASVQQYCWATIRRLDLGIERAWARSQALADLLDRIGLARYAAIARSDETRALLAIETDETWETNFRAHMHASGVAPPDTRIVSWQPICTISELDIVDRIAATLEVATITDGVATTGRATLSLPHRESITPSVLATGRDGHTLLDDLLDCRIDLWSTLSPTRAALYDELASMIHAARIVPLHAARTAYRYLQDVGEDYTRAAETDNERQLRLVLQRLGIVHRAHGRTALRARARNLSIDDVLDTLVHDWIGTRYTPEAVIAEALMISLASTARGATTMNAHFLADALLTEEGWHDGISEAPVRAAARALGKHRHELEALGILHPGEEKPDSIAVIFACAVLRARLLPARYPRGREG